MKFTSLLIFSLLVFSACKKSSGPAGIVTPPIDTTASFFAKGADISWVTQMESQGLKFYDRNGVQADLYQILKTEGMNGIRLRAWVNPSGGWCNTADLLAKALRAKALGFKILIDFHYSDSWADPGQQNKPAAWATQNIATLNTSLYNYTLEVLNTLKQNNIVPDWVQIGNETNDGMLWPEGKASVNMQNFASLIKTGYNAVKAVDSTTKVIVHISNGYDNVLFRWIFDGLKSNGANWDVIGMSLYPSAANWGNLNTQCLANMNDMVSRYGKEVMVCEVGMSWTDSIACKSFIADLITKTKSVSGGKGLGVFYWEPESYNKWQGYTLGAFDDTGKPTIALDGFK